MTAKNDWGCWYCLLVLFILAILSALIYSIFFDIIYLVNVQFRLDMVLLIVFATVLSSLVLVGLIYIVKKTKLLTLIIDFFREIYSDEPLEKEHVAIERSRTVPKQVQREVWRRDMGRCVECGSNERLEFDHIIPFSKGGSNTARNIQLLCESCNRKKTNKI